MLHKARSAAAESFHLRTTYSPMKSNVRAKVLHETSGDRATYILRKQIHKVAVDTAQIGRFM